MTKTKLILLLCAVTVCCSIGISAVSCGGDMTNPAEDTAGEESTAESADSCTVHETVTQEFETIDIEKMLSRDEVFTGEDDAEKLEGEYYLILQDNEDEKIPVDCYVFDGTRKQFVIPVVQTLQQLGAEIEIKREWDTIEIRWEDKIAVLDFYNEVLYDYYRIDRNATPSLFNEQIHRYTFLALPPGGGRQWKYVRFDWENKEVYVNDTVFSTVLFDFGVWSRTKFSTEFGDNSGVRRYTVKPNTNEH